MRQPNYMKIEQLQNNIAECEQYIMQLSNELEKNNDLYIEGYGSPAELRKCNTKIQREISKTQTKIRTLTEKLNKARGFM